MSAPALDPRLALLLDATWPGLAGGIVRAADLGFSWADISTPFLRLQGARAVAHVGVIELPLVVAGRRRPVASIHAVCTAPDARGRGHCRALLEQALEHCDRRYETAVLTTAIPGLYRRFGFRRVAEHRFVAPVAPAARRGPPPRALSAAVPGDVSLLRRLLERRVPVSARLGVVEPGAVFVIALMLIWGDLARVHHFPDLDVVTVHAVRDRTLVLYDVVGETIPPLSALLKRLEGVDRVVACFTPDRLEAAFSPEPIDAERARAAGDHWYVGLMARGPLDIEHEPFLVPPLART